MTVPVFNMTDTWTDSGTTYNAIKMTVTNTAFATASKYIDIVAGSTSIFFIDSDGAATFNQITAAISANSFSWRYQGTLTASMVAGNTTTLNLSNSPGSGLIFSNVRSGINMGGGSLIINDEATAALGLKLSTTPTTTRFYNTTDNNNGAPTNYERFAIDWTTTTNVCYLRTERGGTGSSRIALYVSGLTTTGALPASSTVPGGRATVTDSSVTTFNTVVGGTGATTIPVWSDGSTSGWRVG